MLKARIREKCPSSGIKISSSKRVSTHYRQMAEQYSMPERLVQFRRKSIHKRHSLRHYEVMLSSFLLQMFTTPFAVAFTFHQFTMGRNQYRKQINGFEPHCHQKQGEIRIKIWSEGLSHLVTRVTEAEYSTIGSNRK